MFILTPLAVQNADVLAALDAGGFGAVADLARKLGKTPFNLTRSLKSLAGAGLVDFDETANPMPVLTLGGRNSIDALARAAQDAPGPAAAIDGVLQLLHAHIAPDPLNPRKHFDEDAIAELADSIAQDDLLENLVVRPAEPDGTHRLVAGERRWRAIARLVADGRWAADRPILCKVVDIDDAGHRRLALVENLQRKDLRPIDEAEALKALMAITGKGTAEVAAEIGFTQRFVQQRLQLLDLPDDLRDNLNNGETSIEEARRWLAARPRQLQLEPADNLVVMEVAWGMSASPNNAWTTMRHSPHEMTAGLVERKLLQVSGPDHAGHALVRLDKPAWDHVMALTSGEGTIVRTKLEPLVRAARKAIVDPEAAGGPDVAAQLDALFKAKAYLTPWLNPPFAIDPEVKARLDARERQEAKWRDAQAKQAQAAAERDAALAAAKWEARTRGRQWLADIAAFETEAPGLVREGFALRFAELLSRYDIPAPYSLALEGDGARADTVILDANGKPPIGVEGGLEARRRLIVIALNYAAGCDIFSGGPLATPWSQDEPDEETDGEEDDDAVQFLDEDDDGEPLDAAAIDEDDEDIPEFLTRLAGGGEEARP